MEWLAAVAISIASGSLAASIGAMVKSAFWKGKVEAKLEAMEEVAQKRSERDGKLFDFMHDAIAGIGRIETHVDALDDRIKRLERNANGR